MIISVASGRGGTGKTTVATNLAVALEAGVQILDCEVEEPYAHLFLNPLIEKTESVDAPVPTVDEEKCNFCEKYAQIWRFSAIAVVGASPLHF